MSCDCPCCIVYGPSTIEKEQPIPDWKTILDDMKKSSPEEYEKLMESVKGLANKETK